MNYAKQILSPNFNETDFLKKNEKKLQEVAKVAVFFFGQLQFPQTNPEIFILKIESVSSINAFI